MGLVLGVIFGAVIDNMAIGILLGLFLGGVAVASSRDKS